MGYTHVKETLYLGHSADILEFGVNLRKRTAFYTVSACDDNSLACLCASLSSSDIILATKSTCTHEARMDVRYRDSADLFWIFNEGV